MKTNHALRKAMVVAALMLLAWSLGGWRIVPALAPLTPDLLQRTPILYGLSTEQRSLSIRILRPHPSMIKELARGWTPERAEELENSDRALRSRRTDTPGKTR